MISTFIAVMIKVFFLLTPFFALSMFLSYTADYDKKRKRKTAVKTSFAVIIITLLIYWFGEYLFKVLGITIDAFRIGAGLVLMLTAISLVNGSTGNSGTKKVMKRASSTASSAPPEVCHPSFNSKALTRFSRIGK